MVDNTESERPLRTITSRYDACIFCGNCHEYCTTEKGINLTKEWDLAGLDREAMARLIRELEGQMKNASKALEFEKAALLRDRIIDLRKEFEVVEIKSSYKL